MYSVTRLVCVQRIAAKAKTVVHSVHVSTSKGLTLARYSAYVFYGRFALPTVLGQSSPPLKRYCKYGRCCRYCVGNGTRVEGRWTGRAKGQRVRGELCLNTGGFRFDFLYAVLLSSGPPPCLSSGLRNRNL